jgi:hypothetical protein
MKTTFYFLLASLFLLPLRLSGQCNVAIPANAIPVFQGEQDFYDDSGDPLWVCQGMSVFIFDWIGIMGEMSFSSLVRN